MGNGFNDLKRLNFEDFLWGISIILGILSILGNYYEKEYIKTGDYKFKDYANDVFETTAVVTLFIYIYFWLRNYNAYSNCSEREKQLYFIKLLGSSFLILGSICLIYFQFRQEDFVGSPGI